uniref:Orc1-like AAA ATPase domain-containing protein n=1 Tax=Grammatophora oceanica TaxID=210454 RepID=A0A7S1UPS3_9STRA|mmetsp:Transcript_1244/g.1765  ORF Transcript_1244/g.1765 Transcript_1244/m.1765 type:complete len:1080 (+) Transcript_1244:123-3362(+)|eukprot:CAMPEP_0194067498 /NCGR_PEP_ID=MMETSP0009_2-20130614/86588_1 /TAXON_ID=210454 /ORGANISM="Grammatophora oceanica, Strain CCMP 410" /LENGTH=1079 /DNA_ID=CAMNT_0038720527 /DNA_START=100 /DNA_END=3339 /DNA_ORIENTATION=+
MTEITAAFESSTVISALTDTYIGSSTEGEDMVLSTEVEAPIRLCGRSQESLRLLKAYHKVLTEKRSRVVCVHGESGMGKTSLVYTLRDVVCNNGGYFCTGKFEQTTSGFETGPYTAIAAAISDLCELISQEKEEQEEGADGAVVSKQNRVRLGLEEADGNILCNIISSLEQLLQREVTGNIDQAVASAWYRKGEHSVVKGEAALMKLFLAFQNLLRAASSETHPIVLFIDDIQWMDEGSRKLLEVLLLDKDLKHVLIVMAFREEERHLVEILLGKDLDNLREDIIDIRLQKLDERAVHHMVTAILGSTSATIRQLSSLLTNKCGGNPFHVALVIEALLRERLIETEPLRFEVEEIRKQIMVSDTVAYLMTRKVQRLPRNTQRILSVASMIGFRFDDTVLAEVAEVIIDGIGGTLVRGALEAAVNDGFIERTNEGFQFCHDKVQSAFRDEVDGNHMCEEINQAIAKAYSRKGDMESIYRAAHHWNEASGLLMNEDEIFSLAELNFQAAKYCQSISAFSNAAGLLRKGRELIDTIEAGAWTGATFDLTLLMTELLAKVELGNGNFDACHELIREVLAHTQTVEQKLTILLIEVDAGMATLTTPVDHVISRANEALAILGVGNIPTKIRSRHISMKLFKIRRIVGSKTDEEILSLPENENPAVTATVRLLFYSCINFKAILQWPQMIYYSLLAMELVLKHGHCPFSAPTMVIYGYAEIQGARGYHRAARFGRLALRLLKSITNKEAECVTIGMNANGLLHWTQPFREMVPAFHCAWRAGLEVGDLVFGLYGVSQSFAVKILAGANLDDLVMYINKTYECWSTLGKNSMIHWAHPSMQFVSNLCSDELDNCCSLTGDIMNEEEHLARTLSEGNIFMLWMTLFFKLYLQAIFGKFDAAAAVLEEMMSAGETAAPSYHFHFAPWQFFGALTHYELYTTSGGRRQHLKTARRYLGALEKVSFCPNAKPFLLFLQAEKMAAKHPQDTAAVTEAYLTVIEEMDQIGWSHMKGLANERVYIFLQRSAKHASAQKFLRKAVEVYEVEWGAVAKAEMLKEEQVRFLVDTQSLCEGPKEGFEVTASHISVST